MIIYIYSQYITKKRSKFKNIVQILPRYSKHIQNLIVKGKGKIRYIIILLTKKLINDAQDVIFIIYKTAQTKSGKIILIGCIAYCFILGGNPNLPLVKRINTTNSLQIEKILPDDYIYRSAPIETSCLYNYNQNTNLKMNHSTFSLKTQTNQIDYRRWISNRKFLQFRAGEDNFTNDLVLDKKLVENIKSKSIDLKIHKSFQKAELQARRKKSFNKNMAAVNEYFLADPLGNLRNLEIILQTINSSKPTPLGLSSKGNPSILKSISIATKSSLKLNQSLNPELSRNRLVKFNNAKTINNKIVKSTSLKTSEKLVRPINEANFSPSIPTLKDVNRKKININQEISNHDFSKFTSITGVLSKISAYTEIGKLGSFVLPGAEGLTPNSFYCHYYGSKSVSCQKNTGVLGTFSPSSYFCNYHGPERPGCEKLTKLPRNISNGLNRPYRLSDLTEFGLPFNFDDLPEDLQKMYTSTKIRHTSPFKESEILGSSVLYSTSQSLIKGGINGSQHLLDCYDIDTNGWSRSKVSDTYINIVEKGLSELKLSEKNITIKNLIEFNDEEVILGFLNNQTGAVFLFEYDQNFEHLYFISHYNISDANSNRFQNDRTLGFGRKRQTFAQKVKTEKINKEVDKLINNKFQQSLKDSYPRGLISLKQLRKAKRLQDRVNQFEKLNPQDMKILINARLNQQFRQSFLKTSSIKIIKNYIEDEETVNKYGKDLLQKVFPIICEKFNNEATVFQDQTCLAQDEAYYDTEFQDQAYYDTGFH